MTLPTLQSDKANHFIYGSFIFALSHLITNQILYNFLILLAFALGKEAYDKFSKKGKPELLDVVASLLGALPILITKINQ